MEILVIILILINAVLMVEGFVAISVLKRIEKRNVTMPQVTTTQSKEAGVQTGNVSAGSNAAAHKEGLIICRNCYGVLPKSSRTCSYCQTAVRR